MSQLTIGFAGTPIFGLLALEAIHHSKHYLRAVYTQPDRPAGRGRKLQASPIKTWAQEHHLPIFQPENFKQAHTIETLKELDLDLLVVIAYGLILPTSVLTLPRYGCINVHASLLPRWRGASPIQQAILHGDQETGVTIMQMDKGMDTGDILNLSAIPIDSLDTTQTLHDKLAALAVTPLLNTIEAISQGALHPMKQDASSATYAAKLTKEEAHLVWDQPAQILLQKIRAYQPWPIAYSHAQGETLRIHEAHPTTKPSHALPGTIVALDKTGIYVTTQDNIIQIKRLQFPGGKVLAVHEWLPANRQLTVGMRLE